MPEPKSKKADPIVDTIVENVDPIESVDPVESVDPDDETTSESETKYEFVDVVIRSIERKPSLDRNLIEINGALKVHDITKYPDLEPIDTIKFFVVDYKVNGENKTGFCTERALTTIPEPELLSDRAGYIKVRKRAYYDLDDDGVKHKKWGTEIFAIKVSAQPVNQFQMKYDAMFSAMQKYGVAANPALLQTLLAD